MKFPPNMMDNKAACHKLDNITLYPVQCISLIHRDRSGNIFGSGSWYIITKNSNTYLTVYSSQPSAK